MLLDSVGAASDGFHSVFQSFLADTELAGPIRRSARYVVIKVGAASVLPYVTVIAEGPKCRGYLIDCAAGVLKLVLGSSSEWRQQTWDTCPTNLQRLPTNTGRFEAAPGMPVHAATGHSQV